MKKTYQLVIEGRHPDRLLEASKHDVRKYMARQRRAALPEGADYWDFACQFGLTEIDASPVHVATLIALMDAAAAGGATGFFVDIIGRAAHRKVKAESTIPLADLQS